VLCRCLGQPGPRVVPSLAAAIPTVLPHVQGPTLLQVRIPSSNKCLKSASSFKPDVLCGAPNLTHEETDPGPSCKYSGARALVGAALLPQGHGVGAALLSGLCCEGGAQLAQPPPSFCPCCRPCALRSMQWLPSTAFSPV
jgi:hypothetical protein